MRRLSIALTVSMLLAPATSLAAFTSPSEVFTAIETTDAAQKFSLEAHVHTNGTYVSVWTSGTSKGTDPENMNLDAKATVDIVLGGLKIRAKADVLMVRDMLYVRLLSFDGSYDNAFASVSTLLKQKLWIRMPTEEAMLTDMAFGTPLSVNRDAEDADDMFVMQSSPGNNGTTVYNLSLSPEYAQTLAMMIREILNDTSAASDDFFPWRQLAEGMEYEGTVITDANGALVRSSFSLSTVSESSSLSVKGSTTPTPDFTLTAPADSVTADELMLMFQDVNGFEQDVTYEEDIMEYDEEDDTSTDPELSFFTEEQHDTVPADCYDPDMSALKLLDLQRSGVCPVEKTSTRHGGW